MRVRVRVIELHDIDTSRIVQVPRVLIVGAILREGGVQAELVGVRIEAKLEVVAQNEIDQHGLARLVVAQARGAVRGEQRRSQRGQRLAPAPLLQQRVLRPRARRDLIERAPIEGLDAREQLGRARERGRVVAAERAQKGEDDEVQVGFDLGRNAELGRQRRLLRLGDGSGGGGRGRRFAALGSGCRGGRGGRAADRGRIRHHLVCDRDDGNSSRRRYAINMGEQHGALGRVDGEAVLDDGPQQSGGEAPGGRVRRAQNAGNHSRVL